MVSAEQPKSPLGSSVQAKPTPQVASPIKTGKYGVVIITAIFAAILGRSLWVDSVAMEPKKQNSLVKPAFDSDASQLNLQLTPAEYAAALPVLPAKPLPPPPAVLPNWAEEASHKQTEDARRKSPTNVYGTEQKTDNTRTATSGSSEVNGGFLQQAANTQVVTVSAKRNTNVRYKILQGKLIAAVLETAINSDLPGMVRAVISKDIYSDTGDVVLLPRGTRLVGQYSSSIAAGQTRIVVVWMRAITPQYVDISLGSPSTDPLGQAGMGGEVDNHFWQIFGASALLSVLGVASSNTGNNGGVTSGNGYAYGNPYQNAMTQGALNTSNAVLQNRMNIQPTIRVEQGSLIQVFVARDLDFSATV